MKVRLFCTALTLLVSLVMINSPAFGQNKQARCDTLKADSKLLQERNKLHNDILTGHLQIVGARDDLSLFNRALAALDDADWRTSTIRAEFNRRLLNDSFTGIAKSYGVDQNFDTVRLDDDSLRWYLRAIRPYIIQRIDRLKFVTENPEAAQKELEYYEKQLASIDAEIRDLKCNEPEKPESTCSMEGSWTQHAVGLGNSTWYVTADGKATESGLGGSTGTASLSKNVMRIDWTNPNGWSGYYEWTMDAACSSGEGQLVFKSGGSGSRKSTVTH